MTRPFTVAWFLLVCSLGMAFAGETTVSPIFPVLRAKPQTDAQQRAKELERAAAAEAERQKAEQKTAQQRAEEAPGAQDKDATPQAAPSPEIAVEKVPRPAFSGCAADDRRCEVEKKSRGLTNDATRMGF
jgi:hypothetical protein